MNTVSVVKTICANSFMLGIYYCTYVSREKCQLHLLAKSEKLSGALRFCKTTGMLHLGTNLRIVGQFSSHSIAKIVELFWSKTIRSDFVILVEPIEWVLSVLFTLVSSSIFHPRTRSLVTLSITEWIQAFVFLWANLLPLLYVDDCKIKRNYLFRAVFK